MKHYLSELKQWFMHAAFAMRSVGWNNKGVATLAGHSSFFLTTIFLWNDSFCPTSESWNVVFAFCHIPSAHAGDFCSFYSPVPSEFAFSWTQIVGRIVSIVLCRVEIMSSHIVLDSSSKPLLYIPVYAPEIRVTLLVSWP